MPEEEVITYRSKYRGVRSFTVFQMLLGSTASIVSDYLYGQPTRYIHIYKREHASYLDLILFHMRLWGFVPCQVPWWAEIQWYRSGDRPVMAKNSFRLS